MEKSLSIIIPAYNVSQYIEQGMDSLLAEESIIPYLDIVIVNDGSKDDTLKKAIHYQNLYPDSVSIIDKENGGHGSGINVGIKAAKGKYLKILDGDDWVRSDGLKELVDFILSGKIIVDAIINPFEKVWEDGRRELVNFDNIKTQIIVGFTEVNASKYTLSLHALTIRTAIYKENNIPEIDEKISYDDMEYILYPVPYINSITFLDAVIYEYRLGLSGQSMNLEQMKKNLPMHIHMIMGLAEYFRRKKDIFKSAQEKYYTQEFVDTLATNCEIRLKSSDSYKEIKSFINNYDDFRLWYTRKRSLKIIIKYGRIGYYILKGYYYIRK